jgi:hypothetical protein
VPLQTPTIARESLYTCGYLGVVPVLRDVLLQRQWSEGTATMTAAVSGGLLAAIASQPPDTIKTRMQVPMQLPVAHDMWAPAKHGIAWRHSAAGALFRSHVVTCSLPCSQAFLDPSKEGMQYATARSTTRCFSDSAWLRCNT